MASGYEMRVGHAERDATAAELREHYAAGRLTLDELNERLDKVFAAKTRGDLSTLMTDLPSAADTGSDPAGAGIGAGGPSGGPGSWGRGQRAGWGAGYRGSSSWGTGPDTGWNAGRRSGQALAAIISGMIVIVALLTIGSLAIFGIGAGRPFGIVLLLAALAFLRRVIFGRRRRCGRGPRTRRGR